MKIPGLRTILSGMLSAAVIGVAMASGIPAYAAPPAAPAIYLSPATLTLGAPGSTVNVDVMADTGSTQIRGFDITINYPAALLHIGNGNTNLLWDQNLDTAGYTLSDWGYGPTSASTGGNPPFTGGHFLNTGTESIQKIVSSANDGTGIARLGLALATTANGGPSGTVKLFTLHFTVQSPSTGVGRVTPVLVGSSLGLLDTSANFVPNQNLGGTAVNPVAPSLTNPGPQSVAEGTSPTTNLVATSADGSGSDFLDDQRPGLRYRDPRRRYDHRAPRRRP